MKNIAIIGGGTVSHVRNHLALTAPAYGTTANKINALIIPKLMDVKYCQYTPNLYLTKMASAGNSNLETNQDIENLVDTLIADSSTKIIFFNPALVDFDGSVLRSGARGYQWADDLETVSGKYEARLKTSEGDVKLLLTPANKIINKIRKDRKDIFLVGFKTTCGASEDEQFLTGLHLLKSSSCNLVLANDTKTRLNMIITPEQARYSVSNQRDNVLSDLVNMVLNRSQSTFTRSTVIHGGSVAWEDPMIPKALRAVVNHCIKRGAYKPFWGATVGHFAVKVNETTFLTSKRKTNFNNLNEVGLVEVESDGPDSVIAYGGKPSVGGQSQRIVFKNHPDVDCIVHFHCPPTDKSKVAVRPQQFFECGSHECGQNTSDGLLEIEPGIKVVYLDNHGPNIVFNRNIDPIKVINFIDNNFDLSKSTDGINNSELRLSIK